MNILIVAHLDPDGILSARLIQKFYSAHDVKVIFPPWHRFEIPDEQFDPGDWDEIFIVDLGTDKDRILMESQFIEENEDVKITHVDHHPTDLLFLGKDRVMMPGEGESREIPEGLEIIHSVDNCATGLTFLHLFDLPFRKGIFDENFLKWMKYWVSVGIYADVAVETKGAQKILSEIRKEYPVFFSYWYKEKAEHFEDYGEAKIPYPTMIGRLLNIPRKIAFNKGPPVALFACSEIEHLNGFEVLFDQESQRDSIAPNARMLREWEDEFTDELGNLIKGEQYQFFDLTSHGYCILNRKWNLGSDLARLLSRRYKKGVVSINIGLDDVVLISGRNPQDMRSIKWDLGKVFSLVSKRDDKCLSGGGHKNAAGSTFKKGTDYFDIMNSIEKEFRSEKPVEAIS